ncbi:MAG: 3-dehydroquinate synthase, partial [Chloroflexota bacterium]|nr:3-dehydroquinate synthase [Chloroflexota bacterium]
GYSLLHGEAVAVGMAAALSIAREQELIDSAFEQRVRAVIDAYGLPLHAEVDMQIVREKMSSDKKKAAGKQRWVLPVQGGGVVLTDDVPDDCVIRAIACVTRSGQ